MQQNKPSQTALPAVVASLCLSVDHAHPGLVSHEYANQLARLMLATGEMSSLAVRFFRTRIGLWLVRKRFDKSIPGQFAEFGKRKAYFEAQARDAIAAGAHQILVLGAGYDLLCLRLAPEFPGVCFFEIDHPATASAKRRGLDILGKPENLWQISGKVSNVVIPSVTRIETQDIGHTRSFGHIINAPLNDFRDLRFPFLSQVSQHLLFIDLAPCTSLSL